MYWISLYKRARKIMKKSVQKSVPASLGLRLLYTITLCAIGKNLQSEARCDSRAAALRTCATQVSPCYIQLHFFKKTSKKVRTATFATRQYRTHAGCQTKGTPAEADLTVLYTIHVFSHVFLVLGRGLPARRGFGLRTGMHLTPGRDCAGLEP